MNGDLIYFIDMKTHYVYKITDSKTKQFYIGSRTCECLPINDDYMGSPSVWSPKDKNRLEKEIIKSDFKTRKDAIEFEAILIEKNIDNELNENYSIPPNKFYGGMKGKNHSSDTIKKISEGNKGKILSETHINNIREAKLGISHSIDHKNNIRDGVKKYYERNNHPDCKKVIHINTGKIFESQTNAANYFNIAPCTVSAHCNGRMKTKKFKFY